MTNKDLIKLLLNYPMDAEILTNADGYSSKVDESCIYFTDGEPVEQVEVKYDFQVTPENVTGIVFTA